MIFVLGIRLREYGSELEGECNEMANECEVPPRYSLYLFSLPLYPTTRHVHPSIAARSTSLHYLSPPLLFCSLSLSHYICRCGERLQHGSRVIRQCGFIRITNSIFSFYSLPYLPRSFAVSPALSSTLEDIF